LFEVSRFTSVAKGDVSTSSAPSIGNFLNYFGATFAGLVVGKLKYEESH
jgi:hypothetical protein